MCQSLRLKTPISLDNKTENDEIPKPSSPELTADCLDDLDYFKDFENEFPAIVYNDGLTSKSDLEVKPPIEEYTEGIVHDFERRLETIWDRSVNRVHILDFEGLTPEMRRDLVVRLRMVYTGEDRKQSERIVPDKGDFRDYWIKISSDRDFLGPAPSYVHIKDPVRRLCHKMIACTISGKGQGPKKVTDIDLFYLRSMDRRTANVPYLLAQYMFRNSEGRKSGARLSGGHFIGHLAEHFGLVSNEGLREGPERQQAAATGAYEADEAGPIADEGLLRVVESFTTEQSRVSTWLISCMTQLMDAIGYPYQAFDSTLVDSLRMPYQRHVRPRTGHASTSAAPHADDQPDHCSLSPLIIIFCGSKTENDEIPKPSSPELTADCLDDLDYFKDFENEFPAIVYNDGLTSKSDLEVKPPVSSSKYDEEERNALHVTFPDNLKTIKDSNDNTDITPPFGHNEK
ncbi:hypothetical protein Tco_0138485 [Tanacetum coccineum]